MMIADVLSRAKRNRPRKRVGRGRGSGRGKTCGRGHKGQGQRAGGGAHRLTEGGQMPFFRRIPKRGFSNAQFRKAYQIVNLSVLEDHFDDGAKVTPAALEEAGLIRNLSVPVKILGDGEITKNFDVEAARFSTSAAMKITRAGGQIKTLEPVD
jgi:large subunit ribosomal protein L15